MKHLTCNILTIIFPLLIFSQKSDATLFHNEVRQVIKCALGNRFWLDKICVEPSFNCLSKDDIQRYIGTGLILNKTTLNNTVRADSLLLSESEIAEILNSFESIKTEWLTKLKENIIIVPPDTINAIQEREENYWTSIRTLYNVEKVYCFQEPIFLRKNQICLFFWSCSSDFITHRNLSFYKKENDYWKQFISLIDIKK